MWNFALKTQLKIIIFPSQLFKISHKQRPLYYFVVANYEFAQFVISCHLQLSSYHFYLSINIQAWPPLSTLQPCHRRWWPGEEQLPHQCCCWMTHQRICLNQTLCWSAAEATPPPNYLSWLMEGVNHRLSVFSWKLGSKFGGFLPLFGQFAQTLIHLSH